MIVLVAAHDEAERIGATLAALGEAFAAASLWVVDDGSRDGTAAIAKAAGATVVSMPTRRGKGVAITRAVDELLAAGEDDSVLLLCDGDLGPSAARLQPLVHAVAAGDVDLAVASFANRAGGGFGIAVGFARWAIGRRGLRTKAPLSGQRALQVGSLRRLLPLAPGYGMELGMTIDAVRAHMRVREIELDLSHRATGRTPAGFAHRGRQLLDCVRAHAARR